MEDTKPIFQEIDKLVGGWCDRRALIALRCILQGWPMSSPLTDGWIDLHKALEEVRAFAADEITEQELKRVNNLITGVAKVAYRQ